MAKRWKRAFTITELVIVIAVVAILAAVLIPTFANVIKKADESADTQTVKNLNTILSSEETVSREKPLSMAEVVEQAASGGYLVTALTPTSEGYDILWDQTSNRFVLADASGKIVYKDNATTVSQTDEGFWKIYNSENEINKDKSGGSNKYSIYLAEDFSFSAERTLDVTVGVDVGNNADVSVNYADTVAETAVFRTDGGELTIDNSLGTQKHLGDADHVNIVATDTQNCYHEYGATASLQIASGKVVVADAAASVDIILVVAAEQDKADDGVYVEIYNDKQVKIAKEAGVSDEQIKSVVVNGEAAVPESAARVSTLEALTSALADPAADVIYLENDIDLALQSAELSYGIRITRPVTIYGNGYRLYNDAAVGNNARLVDVYQVADGTVRLENISIVSSTYAAWFRGVNINESKNLNLILNDVTIEIPHYYAINIISNNEDLSIEINDSSVSGWATIYNRATGLQLVANRSSFDSVNPTTGGGDSNSFSNVIVAEYYELNGPNDKSAYNTMTFNDCTFTAMKRNPDANVRQVVADVRSPDHNSVYFNNCTFESAEDQCIKVCYDTEYCEDESLREQMRYTSYAYVNGTALTNENYFEYYLDALS